ncbi:CLUMA_CG017231, isoform A [Clunio marinus]|uniref:CLUMA_CG017231, isoform A n=1 Tax=Clunio marinus TaxID=568069 RepID=A0A1J1IVC0_9DIPT|nr:CLUMA_CG017231, isoform A [Clunio marinus]
MTRGCRLLIAQAVKSMKVFFAIIGVCFKSSHPSKSSKITQVGLSSQIMPSQVKALLAIGNLHPM